MTYDRLALTFVVVSTLLVTGLIGWVAYAIYDDVTAETFDLRKDSWTCTASHVEAATSLISYDGGKTQVPLITYVDICDQWSRK